MTILDARDYHQLSKIISAIVPDVIIQLAAVSHANRSNKDPHSTFDHSFRTLENALDWQNILGHILSTFLQVWFMVILNKLR